MNKTGSFPDFFLLFLYACHIKITWLVERILELQEYAHGIALISVKQRFYSIMFEHYLMDYPGWVRKLANLHIQGGCLSFSIQIDVKLYIRQYSSDLHDLFEWITQVKFENIDNLHIHDGSPSQIDESVLHSPRSIQSSQFFSKIFLKDHPLSLCLKIG